MAPDAAASISRFAAIFSRRCCWHSIIRFPPSTAGRRMVSNVPAQALTLMNNEFVVGQAELWSGRMESSFTDPRARLDAMFVRIFGRAPEPAERDRMQTFLARGLLERPRARFV